MAITDFQAKVISVIAKNRSESSYLAGGLVLNADWPRLSDDIDIFQDTDEEIGETANKDIETLKSVGFRISMIVNIYGCVEVEVSKDSEKTVIQWMSEAKDRFFPLIRDDYFGARMNIADLAINKILAASSRSKARDYVDLVSIEEHLAPLEVLICAASGKPPHFSPVRIVEEIRRKSLSIPDYEFKAVRGLPEDFNIAQFREKMIGITDRALSFVGQIPSNFVGALGVDNQGRPVHSLSEKNITWRVATREPDPLPVVADMSYDWTV